MRFRFRPLATLGALAAALLASPVLADPPAAPAASASNAPAPAPAPAATPEPAHPALWKVADADTTIYLFGTIHALPPGIDWFDGKVAKAFDASQELITEIPPQDPGQAQAKFLARAALPEGENLRTLLPADERTAYEAALPKLGLPASAFDRFEPWYAAVLLSVLPLMHDGLARENGVESTLEAQASKRKLERGALETADFQLGLFDALPLDAQKRYLGEVLDSLPTLREDLKAMLAAWKEGDPETLAKLMNAQEDDPELVKVLLTDRNKSWAKWIAARLKQPGTVFLAVGAGHLAGPGSVQEQLAAQGIASERVQ